MARKEGAPAACRSAIVGARSAARALARFEQAQQSRSVKNGGVVGQKPPIRHDSELNDALELMITMLWKP
jgi:hypothetical protein